MSTPTNDLRTALAGILAEYMGQDIHATAALSRIRALLDAHPAPETGSAAPVAIQWAPSGSMLDGKPGEMLRFLAGPDGTTWGYGGGPGAAMTFGTGPWPKSIDVLPGQWVVRQPDGTFTVQDEAPAPVPDTRREETPDVGLAKEVVDAVAADLDAAGIPTTTNGGQRILATALAIIRRHVIPAPPVVDEAEIAKVLASFDSISWANMRRETKDIYRMMATAVAAHLRGATRG